MRQFFDLISIGDNCIDIYNLERNEFYPGGNAVNVSVIARRQGLKVCYYGIFGDDDFGKIIKESMLREGVNIDYCKTVKGNTGYTIVGFNNGDRVFLDDDMGVQFNFELPDNYQEMLINSKINFYSGFTSWINDTKDKRGSIKTKNSEILSEIKKYSVLVAFDFSNITDMNYIESLSNFIDIAFFSLGSTEQDFIDKFLKNIQLFFKEDATLVVTLGKKGSIALKNKNVFLQEPIEAIRVDSLGCGDAFIGAFLAEYIKTEGDIEKCLRLGTKIATENLSHYGAW